MPEVTTKPRWTMLGDGCFRDNILHTRLDGSQFYREWTPVLNDGKGAPHEEAIKIASDCALLGGGWALPADPHVMTSIVNYAKELPAMDEEIAGGIDGGWFWTAQIDPSGSSIAYNVGFSRGGVHWGRRGSGGLVRACRAVPASQA